MTIFLVFGGILPNLRCRFLHLDFGNIEVIFWDLRKYIFYFSDVRV